MAMELDLPDTARDLRFITTRSQLENDAILPLQRLADASREDLEVRQALASHDILRLLRDTVQQHHVSEGLEAQVLRCIGNACAENPSAILLVAGDNLAWIRKYLSTSCQSEIQTIGVKVLYNMCVADFEDLGENPVLMLCCKENFHLRVIEMMHHINQHMAPDIERDMLVDILFFISSASPEAPRQPPSDTLWRLMDLSWLTEFSRNLEAHSLASLIESMITLYRPEQAYTVIANNDLGIGVLDVLDLLDRKIMSLEDSQRESTSADDVAVLAPQAASLIWLLSDVSAVPSFAVPTLQTATVQRCIEIFTIPALQSDRLMTAASLVLGNALFNVPEEASVLLEVNITDHVIHAILRPRASSDLLYALAGFVALLCKSSRAAQKALGSHKDAIVAVTKLCMHDTPQIQQAGIRVLRAVGKDDPTIQQTFTQLAEQVRSAVAGPEIATE